MKKGFILIALFLLSLNQGFAQWTPLTSPTTSQLGDIFFITADTGYTGGTNGEIYKTTDGGTNWVAQTSGYSAHIFSMYFINSREGYAAAGSGVGTIFKTVNGGQTWTYQHAGSSYMLGIHFVNDSVGFCVGYGGVILKTVNRGISWTNQTSGTSQDLRSVYFVDENTGFVAAESNQILKTTNGGASWVSYPAGTPYIMLSIFFPTPTTGYAVGGNGVIVKTTDAGQTWALQQSNTTDYLQSVYFMDSLTGYAVGEKGIILRTTNGGKRWKSEYRGNFSGTYGWYGISISNGTGYLAGFNGKIYKNTCSKMGNDVQTACSTFTWVDGNTYNYSTDSSTFIFTSASGCDSIVNLDLTIKNVDATVTKQSNNLLTANASGATYQWVECYTGFTILPGDTSRSYLPLINGSYAVIVTQNGCTDTSACFVISGIGMNENGYGKNFRLYPNPTKGSFMIELGSAYPEVNITVRNVLGQTVSTRVFYNADHIEPTTLQEPGIYFVEILTREGSSAVFKVVKN